MNNLKFFSFSLLAFVGIVASCAKEQPSPDEPKPEPVVTVDSVDICFPSVQYFDGAAFVPDTDDIVIETVSDTLRNCDVCGYLTVAVYGGDRIRSISLRGNNVDRIAGPATVIFDDDRSYSVNMGQMATTTITLDCGAEGVETAISAETPTIFRFAVPETIFSKGVTVELTNTQGYVISRGAYDIFPVVRNTVSPVLSVQFNHQTLIDLKVKNSMLSFSLSDGQNEYEAFDISNGYINIHVPKGTDMKKMTASFTHKGVRVTVNGNLQISGKNSHNFSNFVNPVIYDVTLQNGLLQPYTVRMFDLPVMVISTVDSTKIADKETYIPCTIQLLGQEQDADYSFTDSLAKVKGRGNSTWMCPKKPYNFKLDQKTGILGMASSKKWCLLANYYDRTLIRNAFCFEIGQMAKGLAWTPHGRYVELIVNGVYGGNYYLCEKLEVEKKRINIDSDKGYLLEYDSYDEGYYFKPPLVLEKTGQPVKAKLKNPVDCAEDDPDGKIFNEIKQYILDFEAVLDGKQAGDYKDYIDMDSFADYFLVQELVGNWDVQINSNHFQKDHKKVLKAGPLWDFDLYTFSEKFCQTHWAVKSLYYPCLLDKPEFVQVLKTRWGLLKSALIAKDMDAYANNLYAEIKNSALRDEVLWPVNAKVATNAVYNADLSLSIKGAIDKLLSIYQDQFVWLDEYINSL